MLSDLRRKKLIHLFNLLDRNGDKRLTSADVQWLVDRLAESRNYAPDSHAYATLQHVYMRVWHRITDQIDANHDDELTLEEWLTYFEQVELQTFQDEFIGPIDRSMVSLLDVNGDDHIRQDDFHQLARGLNIDDNVIVAIFEILDTDHNGDLKPDELGHALTGYFLSDDPDSKANQIFGRITDT